MLTYEGNSLSDNETNKPNYERHLAGRDAMRVTNAYKVQYDAEMYSER